MLKFIGTGSAFNTKTGNTSAFLREGESMLLIDCGGTVFHRLMELKLLEGLKQLNIIITHTHPDHVGSLGDTIFFSHYVLKLTPKVYFPKAEWIREFLIYIGVKDSMYDLIDTMDAEIKNNGTGFKLSFVPVSHVDTMPSFGFVLECDGKYFYYSGDANDIPEDILNDLKNDRFDLVYQDTCGLDYDGNAHLSLRKLGEMIPENLRDKVCCIHHDTFLDIGKVREAGFVLPEIHT